MNLKIGLGADVHKIEKERPCWLFGLLFDHAHGCKGYSDGDVAIHALCDAILSASGMGDIGEIFGIEKSKWYGVSGIEMLCNVHNLVKSVGFEINNAAVKLIGNQPKIITYREEAQKLITKLIEAPTSVSATTTDGLGITGRGEGLAAIATVLIATSKYRSVNLV